jgi:hypothetical protein
MTVASKNDSWGFFSEREMSSTAPEMTAEQEAAATAKWAEITTAAAAHGGLKAYGEYLLAEEEKADAEFKTACEAVLPLLPTFKSDRFPNGFLTWAIHGTTVVALNPYGMTGADASFNSIRRLMKKGKTLVQAIAWHAD